MNRKTIFALTAALTAAACTATPEMIAAQKERCSSIGYAPGTVEHAQCAERGTMQQQSAQNAAVGSALNYALTEALLAGAW